jgi:hypothetical protein
LGALLGAAHRRARSAEFSAWTPRDQGGILERAVTLAGVHEATYLQLCLLTQGSPATTTP